MTSNFPFELLVLSALGVTSVRAWREGGLRPPLFWWQIVIVVVTSSAWTGVLLTGGWRTDFGTALWITAAAAAIVFALVSLRWPFAQKIAPLLMPYLTLLGFLGAMVRGEPYALNDQAPPVWLDLHIAIAVSVTGILTVAAVSALSVSMQERALKTKAIGPLSALLPSVSEAEHLSGVLLAMAQVMLGLGLLSGMTIEYYETGHPLVFDHKTLLSVAAFVLIGLLFIGHRICGVRGRIAARVVLTAYLLIMLASPGVKFVTQVLM